MRDLNELKNAASEGNVILDAVPEELYHAFPAMSASGLKEFKKSPGYWKWMRENPSQDSQARLEGRLVHMALAEPERFQRQVTVIDGNRNGTVVKEQIATAKARGLTVCKSEDLDIVKRIVQYFHGHSLVKNILKSGKGEQSFFWKDPITGVQCKARADFITTSGVMIDFKTYGPIYSDDEIERQCRKMAYHWQSAWYLEAYFQCTGKKALGFYHVFIRNDDPIDLRVIELSQHSLEEALPHIGAHLKNYSNCLKTNEWPMSPEEVTGIELKPFFS